MTAFANNGLLYERYYYYDTATGQYFNFDRKEDEDIALPFFRNQHERLCAAGLPPGGMAPPPGSNTCIPLYTTYPGLATGTGNTHETGSKGESKLGFFFDYSSGLPVIPGSAVKGVLRSAFPQWDKHTNTGNDIKEVKTRFIYGLTEGIEFEKVPDCTEAMIGKIKGIEEAIFEGKLNGEPLNIYQRDIFYDAVIGAASNHDRTKNKLLGTDSITPHDVNPLRNPKTLPFIKILPGIRLNFYFTLTDHGLPVAAKEKLFRALLTTFGAGAKTNVGYGQLEDRLIQ